jgi:hypothetical protein
MNNKNIIVALFYADWCPHCRNFFKKDENNNPLSYEDAGDNSWQSIKKNLTEVAGIKVTCFEKEESECSDSDKKLVNGWPTIVVKMNNDQHYIYKGGRNLEEIQKSISRGLEQIKDGKELIGGYIRDNIKYANVDYRHKYKKYKKLYLQSIGKY